MSNEVTVDIITREPKDGGYNMVLVVEGPWPEEEITSKLYLLQDRLYNCVNAAVDGIMAEKYPDSKGKDIIIQLDCYDTPQEPVAQFFERFSQHIKNSEEVYSTILNKGFIKSLQFKYNWDTLNKNKQ